MLWIVLIILLVAIFGLGSVLEAALWVMLVLAVLAVLAAVGVGRMLSR